MYCNFIFTSLGPSDMSICLIPLEKKLVTYYIPFTYMNVSYYRSCTYIYFSQKKCTSCIEPLQHLIENKIKLIISHNVSYKTLLFFLNRKLFLYLCYSNYLKINRISYKIPVTSERFTTCNKLSFTFYFTRLIHLRFHF